MKMNIFISPNISETMFLFLIAMVRAPNFGPSEVPLQSTHPRKISREAHIKKFDLPNIY